MFECPVRLKICKGEGLRKRFSYRELLPYESLPSPLPLRLHLEQREVCEQVTCSSTVHGKGCTKVSLRCGPQEKTSIGSAIGCPRGPEGT